MRERTPRGGTPRQSHLLAWAEPLGLVGTASPKVGLGVELRHDNHR